ncbi:MAG: hypothetical protein Q9213_007001 [Squamulea squamosa]
MELIKFLITKYSRGLWSFHCRFSKTQPNTRRKYNKAERLSRRAALSCEDHCIEILRQKLTCDADVGVITYNWVAIRDLPWPNFNVLHKCRNFDGVVEWSKKHNAPYNGVPLKKPSWVKGLENPP